MLAIDTNIVVRFLVNDHPAQAAAARRLIETNQVLLSDTVLLETDWVLRSTYLLSRAEVLHGLRDFADLTNVVVEQPDRLAKAFDFVEAGLDFADALHLAHAAGCAAFASFDRDLIKTSRRTASVPVYQP